MAVGGRGSLDHQQDANTFKLSDAVNSKVELCLISFLEKGRVHFGTEHKATKKVFPGFFLLFPQSVKNSEFNDSCTNGRRRTSPQKNQLCRQKIFAQLLLLKS